LSKLIKVIAKAFTQLGIILKDELTSLKLARLANGGTNKYMIVQDIHGIRYLIRVNGKLFPPFTRTHEHDNLQQLKQHKITNNVLLNDRLHGFQICVVDSAKNFSEISIDRTHNSQLVAISQEIKKCHEKNNFQNRYPVANTAIHSLKKLPKIEQVKVESHLEIILRMLFTLALDENNHVSSHNDLLPSNVYIKKRHVHFVDWEYAAVNHRAYDLSYFIISAALAPCQEQKLIDAYDPLNTFATKQAVLLTKPVIYFLLITWNLAKFTRTNLPAQQLRSLTLSIQDVYSHSASKRLTTEIRFFHTILRDAPRNLQPIQNNVSKTGSDICLPNQRR